MAAQRTGPVVRLAARLGALGALCGLAALSALQGTAFSERELAALLALVMVGLALALVWGGLERWAGVQLPRLELACDFALIALLVYCTGALRSWLSFLFVVWITAAALRAGPRAALIALAWATAGYAAVAVAPARGWLAAFGEQDAAPPDETSAVFAIHLLAFLGVALLARTLARQVAAGRRELSELGEIHRRIVDNVPSGLLSVGRDGAILSYNPEAERITGLEAAQVVGRPLAVVFPELGSAKRLEELAGSHAPGRPARFELAFQRADGERRLLGLSAAHLHGDGGAPQGAIVIFQDLTRIAEMEEQLRRSQRLGAVGQLAAGLAHEIRNPLASLSGAVELLAADLPADDASSRRLAEIVRCETARLNRLVTDFLTYARPGPGELERVKPADLLAELAQLWAPEHSDGVELRVHADPHVEVRANPDQLRQVLWNLLRNAAEAQPSDGTVHVAACIAPEDACWVQIEVTDRGVGIPPGEQQRIFEPFYTTKPKGTGLGLATVHRIVEAHGGRLTLASRPGEGTRVRVLLRAA